MPFDKSSPVSGNTGVYSPWELNARPGDQVEGPGAGEAFAAGFRNENTVGSFLASEVHDMSTQAFNRVDSDFQITKDMLAGYEDHEDRLLDTYNPQAFEAVKADIDREKKDRETLQATGWGIAAEVAASTLDWPTLLPGGALIRTGRAGYSLLRSGASVGMAAGGGASLQEIGNRIEAIERVIADNQKAFPENDIIGTSDFGPIIDTKAYNGDWGLLVERMRSMQDGEAPGALSHPDVGAIDLPWGRYDGDTRQGYGLSKIVSKHPEVLDNLPDIVANTPVKSRSENRIRLENDQHMVSIRLEYDGQQKTWILTAYEKKAWREGQRAGGTTEFPGNLRQETTSSRPLADGNIGASGGKRQSLQDLHDELRVLRSDKNMADTRAINAKAKVEKLKPMLPKDRGEELDFAGDEDVDGYVDEIVNGTFDKIMGRTVEDVPDWMVPVSRGPLKGRTLNIPDELIEEFLEDDMEMIARRYVRQMASEVELTRAFGRSDMKDQIADITAEYDQLRAKTSDSKELEKLRKRERADIMHVEAFRDMLRGTYRAQEERSNWSAFTRLALSWNYIRLLGGVTLSSLPDLANVMTRQGIRSFLDDGLTGLVSSSKAAKIAKRDAREVPDQSTRISTTRE